MSNIILGKKIFKWAKENVTRDKVLKWTRYNKENKNFRRKARYEHTSVNKYALSVLSRFVNQFKIAIKYSKKIKIIQKLALIVVSELGFGYKECVYREALAKLLVEYGFMVSSEVTTPIIHSGSYLSNVADKVDILVDDSIVLELKTANKIQQKHIDQLHRYFRGNLRRKIGMVICFKDASSIVPCKPVMFRTLLVRD